MTLIFLKPLNKEKYKAKFKVIILDRRMPTRFSNLEKRTIKTIMFGDNRYEDYTQHKNKERKRKYMIRHFQNEDWNDIYTKGFWSKNLLWNKPTIEQSIADIEKKYGVIIYR